MWRFLANIAVVAAAVVILTACSSPAPEVEATSEVLVGDLVEEGHSVEVSTCVTGLADGIRAGDDQIQLIEACERADRMLNEPDEPPAEIAFKGPTTYGDDADLDLLWDECEAGNGESCDALWESAPVESEYEQFGVTCGEREHVLNCSDLQPDDSVDASDGDADDTESATP